MPRTIATKAVEYARSEGLAKSSRRKKSSFERKDEVWAVFDRDDHPYFDEAVKGCLVNGVRVARSNPCFELWLILHECDHDRPESSKEIQRTLKTLRPDYDRRNTKLLDFDEMVTRVETAEGRGNDLVERRGQEGNPYGNPSTTVGTLTRAIRLADASSRRK